MKKAVIQPPQPAGAKRALLEIVRGRRRRVRKESAAVSHCIQEQTHREAEDEEDPAADWARREPGWPPLGQLVSMLEQVDEVLAGRAECRYGRCTACEEEIPEPTRTTITPQGIRAHPHLRGRARC